MISGDSYSRVVVVVVVSYCYMILFINICLVLTCQQPCMVYKKLYFLYMIKITIYVYIILDVEPPMSSTYFEPPK